MKQALINYIKHGKCDTYRTPPEAVYPLLPYLEKYRKNVFKDGAVFWECCDSGNSNITRILKEKGFSVISTDITRGHDFLSDPPLRDTIIITNPPYSLKTEFLKRAYELQQPFCFLLPITTLEGVARGKLFREYGLELAVLDHRINYIDARKNVWFNSSWFCWGVLPDKLIFLEVNK